MTDNLFPFTASNGKRIEVLSDGQLCIAQSMPSSPLEHRTWAGPDDTQALREFFQAERDASLGRWRSKEHPDYVVYPKPTEAHERAFGTGLDLMVLCETDGAMKGYVVTEDDWPEGRGGGSTWRAVAREYLAAHPEPKPWHNAKPGEVWVLTYGGQPAAHVYTDRTAEGLAFLSDRAIVSADDPDITAGRRIFPEVNS